MSGVPEKVAPSVYQMVDKAGAPAMAAHTELIWVGAKGAFGAPTEGNVIIPFTTGEEYFTDLVSACDGASSEIYMAGWQINWDAMLMPGVRLYDLFLRNARRGIKIYVMPWADTEPVQTYDDQTKVVMESINKVLANEGAKGKVYAELSPSMSGANANYFSHHQKQVVIDRKIACVGGMDVAYGRMDDATFDLNCHARNREVLNRYNPCIPPVGTTNVNSALLVDPDLMVGIRDTTSIKVPFRKKPLVTSELEDQMKKIAAGGWQIRYGKPALVGTAVDNAKVSANTPQPTFLAKGRQPRMPWQDLHCRIEGPAVSDLSRNFISRWNCISKTKLPKAPLAATFPKDGKAKIQVLRSASANHCAKESAAAGEKGTGLGQTDIQLAMDTLIAKARRFIYIENQFFVSDFGELGGPTDQLSAAADFIMKGPDGIPDWKMKSVRIVSEKSEDKHELDQLPQNTVLKSILARLKTAIVDDHARPKFHVYITLPVHPEGALCDASIAVQVYYTMQTLVFGSHSLLNGIRRLIKARELRDKGDEKYMDAFDRPSNTEYKSVDLKACDEYVTLLNLRNWELMGEHYVTEQIYVHTKLMIVDDRFALFGSANINDRSLLGERDSELAVLVQDDKAVRADINGKGSNQPVRVVANELRKKIWKKIFGITGGVRPATGLAKAIEEPGHPESWKKIQAQARSNAELYEQAFAYIPRNFSPDPARANSAASIIPTWNPNLKRADGEIGAPASPLPYEEQFWIAQRHSPAAKNLVGVKGYITALPIHWTKGENIRIPFPTAIIVHNDKGGSEADKYYDEPKIHVASLLSQEKVREA